MKKIMMMLMLFFVSMSILSAVEIMKGVDMIDVPPKYEDLKKKYIQCVLDLFKEMDEHKKTLTLLSNVQTQNSNLIVLLKQTRDKLAAAYKTSRSTFQNYFSISTGYGFENKNSIFGIGWTGIWYEKISFGVRSFYPYALVGEIGYRFGNN